MYVHIKILIKISNENSWPKDEKKVASFFSADIISCYLNAIMLFRISLLSLSHIFNIIKFLRGHFYRLILSRSKSWVKK